MIGKKKVRLSSIIENNNNENDSESSEDMKKYKKLISGRLNIKNSLDNDESWKPGDHKNKKEINLPKTKGKESKAETLLKLLPKPKNKSRDKNIQSIRSSVNLCLLRKK